MDRMRPTWGAGRAGAAGQLALALVFGAIAQRSHFCTMGAVSDVVN
jgi:hypothetical protein